MSASIGRRREAGPRGRHRGAALVIALVAMTIVAAVLVLLARQSVIERRTLQRDSWQAQAAWLAESALDRAAARLAADREYTGETWNLSADDLGTGRAAVVTIDVQEVENDAGRRAVRVRADYPNDSQQRVRQTKQFVVEIEP